MRFLVDGVPRDFTEIQSFRKAHDLPESFGLALFEPKNYTGLGRIDRAGAELNALRTAILAAIPEQLSLSDLPELVDELEKLFQDKLYEINPAVGLRDVEVEFAVSGFSDVNRALMYALMRALAEKTALPTFKQIYQEWLDTTIRVSQKPHTYKHDEQTWQIHIVNHVYGRVGMIVETGQGTHYVYDGVYACPAEGFMVRLLQEVAARITGSLSF